jgi:hypothetical protein
MSTKNKWLIKSDYKILGPYSYEQVEDLIMKKQISLIDEIRDMNTRWSYVREVPEFKSLVEVVRTEIDQKSELTQTLQTSLQRTNTATVTAEYQKTVTAVPSFTGVDMGQNEAPKKTPSPPTLDASEIPSRFARNMQNKPRIDDSAPRGLSSSVKGLLAISLLALVVGGLWYYDNNYGQNKSEKLALQQIRKYNLYAQDEKSIEVFKTLTESSQDKILGDLIPLWPKLQAAGALSSNRILDFIAKDKIVGNERKSQYQLVKFNRALNLGDIQNAKDALVKAIDLDPSSLEVKENDAVLFFSQKKYLDAAKVYKNLYTQFNQGSYLYGYTLGLIYEKSASIDIEQAYQMIEKHLAQRSDFNKELLFLQMYLLKKRLSLPADTYEHVYRQFTEFPYQFARKFRRSSLVSNEVNNWASLDLLRQELLTSLDAKTSTIVNLHYLLEVNQLSQFWDLFQKKISSLTENEKYNLQVAYYFLKKSPQEAVQLPLNAGVTELALSTQLYLLMIHSEFKSHSTIQLRYVNMLMKGQMLFSTWAQLMTLKFPEDKEQMKSLVTIDKNYSNEFLPYLEYKAQLNESAE